MAAPFFGYSEPQWIDGPTVADSQGPQWERCEGSLLCTGNPNAQGGFSKYSVFPDQPGFVITEISTQSVAAGGYIVRLAGMGSREVRAFSRVISFAANGQAADVEIGGLAYNQFKPAWPKVDLLLNQVGFRQTVVGIAQVALADMVGQKVSAPAVGPFPKTPDNPWSQISNPTLNYPFGWCLARVDAEPLVEGGYTGAGPWLAVYDFIYRWKFTNA